MSNYSISFCMLLLLVYPTLLSAWQNVGEDPLEDGGKAVYHLHRKRHMLPSDHIIRRRGSLTTQRTRETRKKPSGNLKPLDEDDMDDEVMSVAIGPPPMKPKFDRGPRKQIQKANNTNVPTNAAVSLVTDVLTQLGKDFLSRQVSEDFVFGQYVGNAMKNLSSELRLSMQHEVLELIVKYQKMNTNNGESVVLERQKKDIKAEVKLEKKMNETEDSWPDFSNLAKIMG